MAEEALFKMVEFTIASIGLFELLGRYFKKKGKEKAKSFAHPLKDSRPESYRWASDVVCYGKNKSPKQIRGHMTGGETRVRVSPRGGHNRNETDMSAWYLQDALQALSFIA